MDHPRVCGEKLYQVAIFTPYPGSPPRVRGKVLMLEAAQEPIGITPACAGKRACPSRTAPVCGDHPRVCGEKLSMEEEKLVREGSPPRVRGKAYRASTRGARGGITPACAGKRLKKAHKIKDFDPVPIRFHLVFRRFERWCSNLPTPDGNVPV